MLNSIRYFEEKCISKFEKLEDDFMKEPTKIAEYVMGLTEELHCLGLRMIQESLESMDEMLQESQVRKKNWVVESHSSKKLITYLGEVTFDKTLFKNKKTGKSEYLLDRVLGLEKKQRLTEDAEAHLLKEAVQTSYRRGGEESSLTTSVGKQTVKNKIHSLKFPKNEDVVKEKKVVDYLYIEADEDHVSLQFREKKGDLIQNENQQKNNCAITKLVYVHEGIEREAPKSKRYRLINPYYFSGTRKGDENKELWDEVYDYMDRHYDLEKVKRIYLNSDGGAWIKAGNKRISNLIYVLDGFHLDKYIVKLTSHMLDTTEDAKTEVRTAIRKGTKDDFRAVVDCLKLSIESASGLKRIENASDYILSNWTAAKYRLCHKEGVVGSSTEGHVSHLLSDRMSSRPMGWSQTGADKMSQLRVYEKNGGDMLELVRYQKRDLPKADGAEYEVLSSVQILQSEKNRHGELGKYVETINHHMSIQNKKKVYFNVHIWGL